MLTAFGMGLVGTVLLFAGTPPELTGEWSGDGWGNVVLKQVTPEEYTGTCTGILDAQPAEIQLKWSPDEQRFNGTWRDGGERFGELSIRRVGNQVRGAFTTVRSSTLTPAAPRLGEVAWTKGPLPLPGAVRPLDLTPWYTMRASRFDLDKRYPWRAVPRGAHTFGNVPFEIGGGMPLWGGINAQGGLVFAETADNIQVNRTFDALYVYHATFHVSDEGAPVYDLLMQHADGTSSPTTLRYGTHVRDWYLREGYPLELTDPKSKVAWEGDPVAGLPYPPLKLRFYITTIPNPKPTLEVKAITLVSAKGKSAACILAMTTGPDDLLKVDGLEGK